MAPRVSELSKNPRERLCLSPSVLPSQSFLWNSTRRSLIVAHLQQQPPQGVKGFQIRIKFSNLGLTSKSTQSSPPENSLLEILPRGRSLEDSEIENSVAEMKPLLDWKRWPPKVALADWNARGKDSAAVAQGLGFAPLWNRRRRSRGILGGVSFWPGTIWAHAWVWARFFGPNPRFGLRLNFGIAVLGSIGIKLGCFPKIVAGVEMDVGKT